MLNTEELKAAELIANGASEQSVAEHFGKSRSWVQRLKRRDDFKEAVEATLEAASKALHQHTEERLTNDLNSFRQRFNESADLIFNTAYVYIQKVEEAINHLSVEDISPARIGSNLKLGAEALALGVELKQAALGIDQVTEQIDELEKLREARRDRTTEQQSPIAEFEAS
ncbi:hypothetical protein F7734_55765 [Scytonema sp. UIC 10036]|uniref:helix-turn-helix domain-containing protein n=1 Tax=Scytonema sp. UIC 10036 TaxID=2304196 RepID=UPI0012DA0365|nr:hypothetical protein [Scytonema sp. UIC 10036]MUH01038.1 hypothetical protein [Scytonema sp. UIC 10036]